MKKSNPDQGKVIVIDGLDGCGKSTQFDICLDNLIKINKKVCPVSFPDYESMSSSLVKMYLNGEISEDAEDINAYAASSFYACDRYISYKKKWEKNYKNGEVILAVRYASSNIIHQMSKLEESEWDAFSKWVFDYEHNKMGVPKADTVIFLDMPVEISEKLLSKRYLGDENKKDVHESNIKYMKKCRRCALYAAKKFDWKVISCIKENDKIRSIEEINKDIMNVIEKII